MASKERDSNHKSPEDIYEEDTDDSDAFIDAIEKQPRGDEFSTGAGGGAAGKAADDDRFQDANEGPDDDKEKEDGNGDDEEEDEVTDELAERRAREEELTENQREVKVNSFHGSASLPYVGVLSLGSSGAGRRPESRGQ